ncbi:glycosyltransferase family 4 protein [Nocardiopsis alborubida]|uniref:Glycosyltransferase family 4 protein n=1 Tax=Nocardiopsis alborubida TaxID=146802 RepID=A0A7X6M9Y9_9ACTN|nr:glycosyltransferase family 4 protein [Nocardiopsis alborubida]NKY96724.1 glycosyltransferase family 4 protein [Nocardiopsis alborubida]
MNSDTPGLSQAFPAALHLLTYDVRGTMTATGQPKPTRQTGLVNHTHQLLRGLAEQHPTTQLTITRTGADLPGYLGTLRTPEGHLVRLRGVATGFPQYLGDAATGGKDPARVQHFYEDLIDQATNPVWSQLARQYADQVLSAGVDDLLVQNINPLVALLKAEEHSHLPAKRVERLQITGVIHDAAQMHARFTYLAQRLEHTRAQVRLIAVSETIRRALIAAGVAADAVRTVFNGMDTTSFLHQLDAVRHHDVFSQVRQRNTLDAQARVVLLSARRVPWKGHEDLIEAAHLLHTRGQLDNTVVAINGAGLVDTRTPHFERDLEQMIAQRGLGGRVVLLDALTPQEVVSCYAGAHVAAHPSREPEPFGYTNIEAMLAGMPVITTAHGGPAEYIDHGHSGLLVPPHNPTALAQALHRVLSDPALHQRLSHGGRAKALTFGLERMFTAYAHVLSRTPAAVKASL